MSIFDHYDKVLPGDHIVRKVSLDRDEYELFPQGEEIFNRSEKTFWPFYLIIILVFGALVAQLLNLQITHGSFNRFLAEGNRVRTRQVSAPRGIIYDSEGKILAANDGSFNLEVYPLDLPQSNQARSEFYQKLSAISELPAPEIEAKIKQKGFWSNLPVVLKENMDRDTALLLQTKIGDLPGVVMATEPVRHYSDIPGVAPVLGYIGRVTDADLKNDALGSLQMDQEVGKDGLEKIYNQYLTGRNGINQMEVDARGRTQRLLTTLPPEPGDNLILSVNVDLEETIAKSLAEQIKIAGVKAGAAVAINPQNGQILAIVSLPTYDDNIFSSGISSQDYSKIINDPNHPLLNRAIAGVYPSGSTIKPLVAAAGLQEGVITQNTTINAPAEIKVGGQVFPDWKEHGLTDVKKAIAESVNIFFYAIGGGWDKITGIGPDKMKAYFQKFGLGSKLGIDLPGEAEGLIPDPSWKLKTKGEKWYLGDSYHMSIGQGDVLATPLQMAVSTAAVANGGKLLQPKLVSKITDQDGNILIQYQPKIIRSNFIDPKNLDIVRQGMRQTVTSGSGQSLNNLPGPAAAKTGTAQFDNNSKTHAWMTAFAPFDNPQIAVAVIVEGGGEGYAAAGPVAKAALNWYFAQNK